MLSIAEPDEGALVVGRTGLAVEELGESELVPLLLLDPALSRVFESQQTAPRSHKLAGSLITTEGLEQKADMSPGKQTPGHLCLGAAVVEVGVALVVVEVVRTVEEVASTAFWVVVVGRGLEEGRSDVVVVPFFCSAGPDGGPSRRLIQHFPPLAQTALESIKSHR